MIIKVNDKSTLYEFIYFIKDLYKNHKKYTYPIFFSQKKELSKIVLEKKTYTALLCKINGKTCGRLLYTIDYSKQRKENIGYFSYFDCVESLEVATELFDYMEKDLSGKVGYIEGTYSPFDPDTRRGILVKGFEYDHTFMTSYNYEYYEILLQNLGYEKAYDTYTVSIPLEKSSIDKVRTIGEKMGSLLDVKIDNLNLRNIEKDIVDIHTILQRATTELNYQEAPSLEVITKFANSVKLFLNPHLVKIAREKSTDKAIGFCLVLPDYNQILKKSNGKINPLLFITKKYKIDSVRGILQYVVPEYQKKGLIALIYYKLYQAFDKFGITKFEGGTILENNSDSWGALVKFGGEITKIYRIMGKNL